MDFAPMYKFFAADGSSTFSASTQFDSASSFKKVYYILAFLCSLTAFLVLVFLWDCLRSFLYRRRMWRGRVVPSAEGELSVVPEGRPSAFQRRSNLIARQARNTTKHTSPETVRILLTSYLEQVVPSIYNSKTSSAMMWIEILKKHALFSVLFQEMSHHSSAAKSALNLSKVWVIQLLQTFLLALLYDLQVRRF